MACLPVARPVVKIGLVAPFEGRYRDVGYEVIFAVRLAVREANAAGIGGHTVELTALDDGGDPGQAAEQARKLTTDPLVTGVIGHWLDATTTTASPIYEQAGLPLIATAPGPLGASGFRLWLSAETLSVITGPGAEVCPQPCDSLEDLTWLREIRAEGRATTITGPPLWGLRQFKALAGADAEGVYVLEPAPYPAGSADPGFAERYRAISGGVEPRFNAVLAYDAAKLLFAAIERSLQSDGHATREGVTAELARTDFDGLSGHISFDATRGWAEAHPWIYQWRGETLVTPP